MGTELKVMIINLFLTGVLLDISYGQSVCDSGPCQNGGTCNDLTTSYTCSCIAGFTGINCETNIDDCSKKPCVYGTCIDGINQYTCICKSGFTGVNCTLDIDECATIAPCQNGGTCTNKFGWYLCTCPAGDYYGNNCEIVSPPPAECSAASRPRVLTDGSGTISSPFYDGTTRYPKNFTCQWIITSGIPNGLISLQFTKTSGCTGDIISLYDGVDITARRIVSTALPSTIAPYTSIAGSSLFITFVSTGTVISNTCTGFIASYTSLPPLPSGCISFYYTTIPKPPMLLTAAAGTLTSTYYPNNYTNWLQCDWLITSVWPTGIVRLDFSDFILGLSTDMVYLYDGNSSYPASMPPLITSLNRTSNPLTTPFSSSQRSMIVRMFADISNNHRGFSATYTSIPPECVAATRPLTASASSSGVISSPNYPNNYFTTGDCQWLITADSNMKVVLQITAFSTDVNDVLYVYDGNSNTATQLSALSGTSQTTPITITTTQNYMFIRFTSDASVVSSGFQATYTQVY